MKLNEHTQIKGVNVILVPYKEHHVPKYHEWMKSPELQQLTASEPLSLEEEYAMQRSWRLDEDKCTFIICDKLNMEGTCGNEIESMVGDTNIFITDNELKKGEIEIMIAEPKFRGRKFGWEAVILMLLYGANHIHLKSYDAKISMRNIISIKMFEKLGFKKISESEVFQEVTLEKEVDENWLKWLNNELDEDLPLYLTLNKAHEENRTNSIGTPLTPNRH